MYTERANVILALLGPTNTGKTYRAIERMLELDSGMIGFPLRLLAREVYDRITSRLGEQAVALLTGEEKRVPPKPRYWVCTVEAMPPEVAVDFVAIDEIQLIDHPERGHVFTDRLLHWRGRAETWFLGSDRVEALIRRWVPGVRVQKLPRLSRLSYTGQSSLRTLPRRSAVVAFSLPAVYELADALRYRRGGAAVVLGALTPRVRNAQVALFQAGEVDFLVATDAIGMGLNLDLGHVALAATSKFDGFELRSLEPAELAQIVGRAGRFLRDGTFGTLTPEPELPKGVVEQLEQHRFAALHRAYYRNTELDFESPRALLHSLERRPPGPGLEAAPDADDLLVLRELAKRKEVTALANTPDRIAALWEVCRIPNYEKRIPEHQAERLWPLFEQLARHGQLDTDFVAENVRRLERFEGDIHTLVDRLAAVRTWTYVSQHSGWVEDARGFQQRTRALEDRLGDLLHERLIERFVEARGAARSGRTQGASAPAPGQPFARLADLGVFRSAEREVERAERDLTERLIAASFTELVLDPRGEVRFEGERVARLEAGPTLLTPHLRMLLPDWVDAGPRVRIERRLTAHARDLVAHLLEPLVQLPQDSAPLRGLAYQLEQSLGTMLRGPAEPLLRALGEAARERLASHGIVLGRFSVYSADMLAQSRRVVRAALCRAASPTRFDPPPLEAMVVACSKSLDRDTLLALGFVPLTSWAVRCDALETLSGLASAEAAGAWLGCSVEAAQRIWAELPRERRRRRRRRSRAAAKGG